MAGGKGSKIEYLDYNAIQKIIGAVLGSGGTNPATNAADATYGYGQTVASSQVSQFAIISVNQWNNLRNDLLVARQHQSGADESGNLALPTLDTKIAEADRAAYLSFANVINTNRLVTPPSSQSSFSTVSTATRSVAWTSSISMTFTVTFTSTDHMRYFFNTGGNFKFSASLTNYTTSGVSKFVNESWYTLLSNMGVITFGANSTTNTGSGTPSSTGFHQLTTTNQLVFTKLVEAGNQYTPNQYDLYARKSGNQIIFTPTWSYTSGGSIGVDFEPVNGTLTSICQMTIASGTNVSITAPTVAKAGSNFA
jgi:hypothetical protein